MGSGQSRPTSTTTPTAFESSGLGELPENCVAIILAGMKPMEICKFAEVNTTFREASLSDYVWDHKLPPNYKFLVTKLFDDPSVTITTSRLSKRYIFSRLFKSLLFDGGTKEIWLERSSGKMCMAISWKGMKITGIDDCRYWTHIPTPLSRFNVVAYLKKIWWLEIRGEVEFKFGAGDYSMFFNLQVGKASNIHGKQITNCKLDNIVHGWDIKPVKFQLSTSNGQNVVTQCYLKEVGTWVRYHVGDFTVENHETPVKINFSMTQIDCTHTKGGLCFDSLIICPADNGNE